MPMDPRSGFCPSTRTFRSLRPPLPLPPEDAPFSFPSFAVSRLPSPLPAHPAFLDTSTGAELSFPALISRVRSLAAALRGALGVSKGDVALVLASPSLHVPVVYLAVLSLGAIVSPFSPLSTAADVARAVDLCGASVVFTTAGTAGKLPAGRKMAVVLLDSPQFDSFLHGHEGVVADDGPLLSPPVEVRLSDVAAISYSSGTTGRTKAAAQSHRRLIASSLQATAARTRAAGGHAVTSLLGVPMFHSYGFHMLMRGVAMAETTAVVTAPRGGGAAAVVAAAARCGATQMFVAPPVVVAMARRGGVGPEGFPDLVRVVCGGAPLSSAAASAFHEKFPDVELSLTGDLCYFDEDGFLYVVDRLKDLIKYNAYQVAPAELEDALHLIPGISDAAVIPYVAPYKKIRKVCFVDSIPRLPSGKLLRRELHRHVTLPKSTSRL
nr:unnamed protein product [Digitaria exilis]